MPWIAQTDFEEEIVNLQPDHDFIYGDLTTAAEANESKQQQIYYPRPKAHIEYVSKHRRQKQQCQQKKHYENGHSSRETVGKTYSAAKMHVISEVQRIAGTKPLGEQPCLDDWDNNDNVERETIALIRHFGMGPSVEQCLDPRLTIPTIVPKQNRFVTNANGRCKVPMIFDENTLKPRNVAVSSEKPRPANLSASFNSCSDGSDINFVNNETPLVSCNTLIDSIEFYSTESHTPQHMSTYEKLKNDSSSSSTFNTPNSTMLSNGYESFKTANSMNTTLEISNCMLNNDYEDYEFEGNQINGNNSNAHIGHCNNQKANSPIKFCYGSSGRTSIDLNLFMKKMNYNNKKNNYSTSNASTSSSSLSADTPPFVPRCQETVNQGHRQQMRPTESAFIPKRKSEDCMQTKFMKALDNMTKLSLQEPANSSTSSSSSSALSAAVLPFEPKRKTQVNSNEKLSYSATLTGSAIASAAARTSASSPSLPNFPPLIVNSATNHRLYQSQKKYFIMQQMGSLKK